MSLSPELMRDAAHALNDFQDPEHPVAIHLWPQLLPLYGALIMAERGLGETGFDRESNLCGRMAEAIREAMIDAELGLRKATPEQRVQHAEHSRSTHG